MIFITTGTTHLPFSRLIDFCIDYFFDKNKETVIIQNTIYKNKRKLPDHIQIKKTIRQNQILFFYQKARIVISAAGEGTIMQMIEHTTQKPILFPRNPIFKEHVDDQQIRIAQKNQIKEWCLVAFNTCQLQRYLKLKKLPQNKFKNNSFQAPLQLINFLHTIEP